MAELDIQDQGISGADDIRKLILMRLLGQGSPRNASFFPQAPEPTGMPPFLPAPGGAAPALPAKPLAPAPLAKPLTAASAQNAGSNVEPGNQPPPALSPILSEEEWGRKNPAAAHTPYKEPDLKHRLLMGLFAGMQEYGRPGQGAATMRNYVGEIERQQEAEKNYPETSAAAQHQKYLTYAQGARQPLDIENLNAELEERRARAAELRAKATAEGTPKPKLQHVVIADPKSGEPIAATYDAATGKYLSPDTGQPIEGAKAYQKVEPAAIKYDSGIPVGVTSKGVTYDIHDPNLPAELKPLVESAKAAHRQFLDEQMEREGRAETRAEKARKEKEEQPTAQTRAMKEMVPKVEGLIRRMRTQIEEAEKGTGPFGARWKEFYAGRVGWSDPAFTKLRTDAGLLQTALMRMHVGARGGELMMQHFKDLFDVGKQHPDNLKAALDEIDAYAKDVLAEGKTSESKTPAAPEPGALPPGWK